MSQPEKQVMWRNLIAEQKESGQDISTVILHGTRRR
jgi:hypothetical protein